MGIVNGGKGYMGNTCTSVSLFGELSAFLKMSFKKVDYLNIKLYLSIKLGTPEKSNQI